mgnify:CR=1 FL=1
MYTGTIQSQVSLQMLDLKWQKKKQDINSKKDTEGMTQDEILLDIWNDRRRRRGSVLRPVSCIRS